MIPNLKNFFGILICSLWIAVPYGWLFAFFFVPFLLVLAISFSEPSIGIPPYEPIFKWVTDHLFQIQLSFSNYAFVLFDDLYIAGYLNSIMIALCATLGCLPIAYPMAYGIVRAPARWKLPLLVMVILPFWVSFLIRAYAWIGILSPQGLLNHFLMNLGLIDAPLMLMGTSFSVFIGIVYSYLPFMILPLYVYLEKIDMALLEAAYDLGCRPAKAFWKVIVPLSLPGVFSGSMLVFIPAVGEFVIPELLGGSKVLMIGKLLWNEFFTNRDWPVAAALAILMLLFLMLPMLFLQRLEKKIATP